MRAIAMALLLVAATAGFCQQDAPVADVEDAEDQVVLLRAEWLGADLTNTSFRVFNDQTMRDLVDVYPAPEGTAMALLPPGDYFVMAIVDVNGNNEVDAGDGFGFHGVSNLFSGAEPAPVTVAEAQLNSAIITIVMVQNEDGHLTPLPSALEQPVGTLQGSFQKGEGADTNRVRLLVALPVDGDARPTAAVIGPDEFEVQLPAGEHRIAILVDEDHSGSLSAGDLVALDGFGDDAPVAVASGGATVIGPLTLSVAETALEGLPPLVAGRLTGAEIAADGRASVAFCTDAQLRDEAVSVVTTADGRYAVAVEPGTYYLRAAIDQDADGALGPGDMLGFFGVDDLLGGDQPAPLEIPEDGLLTDIEVPITARIDEDGKITAHTPH